MFRHDTLERFAQAESDLEFGCLGHAALPPAGASECVGGVSTLCPTSKTPHYGAGRKQRQPLAAPLFAVSVARGLFWGCSREGRGPWDDP